MHLSRPKFQNFVFVLVLEQLDLLEKDMARSCESTFPSGFDRLVICDLGFAFMP
jgi:hypothetical protein